MLQLKIVKGPAGVGQFFALVPGKSLTVGRSEQCELRLPSAGISKTHCRLSGVSGSKAVIEDLGSSNGTFVNGLLVKKHNLKPGDTVALADYVFSVSIEAPKVAMPAGGMGGEFEMPAGEAVITPAAAPARTPAEKAVEWVELNIFPWADKLSGRFGVRLLVGGFFFAWSVILVVMTVSPFAAEANRRVREESVEVAKLYARQLVRLNQQAIIDLNYRDLISELDARRGKTPGIVRTLVIDAKKAQILAPVESMGQTLPNNYAFIATTKDSELVQYDDAGTAYVSAPILVSNPQGVNETVATAYVEFDPVRGQFSFAALLDRAVSSMLYALLASVLLFVFLYRWTEGSIAVLAARVDEAIRTGGTEVQVPVQWPALNQLATVVSSLLARTQSGGGGFDSGGGGKGDWAIATVNANATPSAAFDTALTVIAWNLNMERMIGIRAAMAIGSDISGASRDVSFESAIRSLASQTAGSEWAHATQRIELSGVFYRLSMVYGQGAHLVTIDPEENG